MHLCNLEPTQEAQGLSLDPPTVLPGCHCCGRFITTRAMEEPGKHQALALGAAYPVERQLEKARSLPPHLASQKFGSAPGLAPTLLYLSSQNSLRFHQLRVIVPSPYAAAISVQPQGSQEGIASFPVETHRSKRPHSHHLISPLVVADIRQASDLSMHSVHSLNRLNTR